MRFPEKSLSIFLVTTMVALTLATQPLKPAQAQLESESAAQPLVREMVDDAARVTLTGNVHLMAQRRYDQGPVDDSFPVNRLSLILKRSAAQERALAQYLEDAHTQGSSSYHKWLTPEQFGKRFGPADSDISALTAWLQSRGLTVNKVHPGRIAIEFSGNAAQVQAAFRTQIRRYKIGDTAYYANASNPQIPAAFTSLVAGISPIQSFHARPLIKVQGKTSFNKKTHVARPEWTYPQGDGSTINELTPSDFAVQYDLNPVYKAGTTGAGQNIGILSVSNIDLSRVAAYQALFGLPPNLPTVVIDGDDPGENYAATEAYLDVEVASSVAPGAKVYLYTSEGTVLTDPLFTSGLRALEDNQVSVLSVSYGECEVALGASGNAAWNLLWQEAAAQGITAFVSSGDGGSAGCDDYDQQTYAMSGLAVNGLGSTPYNVSVGGTDLYYSSYAAGGSALDNQLKSYWSSADSTTPTTSLLKPAPEQVWNDPLGLNSTSGGIFKPYGSTILAGSGGPSSAATYSATGALKGYTKPTWQRGTGVPTDGVRDLPDVSLFASNGANSTYYPICALPGDCVNASASGAVYITSVGGTSASAPAMAGIQALVNQATQSTANRQGQANFVYYALAAKALTAKPFRDVTVGTNAVPCYQGSPNCILATAGAAKGFYIESGFPATAGYDRATGLGSVDVANLIANWSAAVFKPTTTTLSISPATFAHGTTVTAKATVAPKTGAGTPTGSVGLNSNDSLAYSNALGVFALTTGSGTYALNNLPGGTYQVTALYSGDSVFGSSTSAPVTITVTPEATKLNTSGWVLNPLDSILYPLQTAMAIPYGAQVYLDAQPVGVNEANSVLAQNAPATGGVAFTDLVGNVSKASTVALNSVGIAEWVPTTLAIGAHKVSAKYAGDGSFAASANAAAASLTVFRGNTILTVSPYETSVIAGSSVTVDVLLNPTYLPIVGALPTGNITVTLGSQTQTATPKAWGTQSDGTLEAVVTFLKVPAGILPLTAGYSGDANWYGTSKTYGVITSLASKPAPAVTLTAPKTAFTPDQVVTMIGTVTVPAGKPVPTGSLNFTWKNGANLNAATLIPGTSSASYTLNVPASQLADGNNFFVATYTGDANYSAQSSLPLIITLNAPDFSLTTTTQLIQIGTGNTGTGSVMVIPLRAYAGTVAVSCSAPAGLTCTPTTAAPTVGAGVSDSITFKAATSLAAGIYVAVVTATGKGHTHTAQILVSYAPAATPSFSPAAGSFTSIQTVTITCATPGAVLYYTTNGRAPTTASTRYTAPIQVKSNQTLKAIAVAPGHLPSTPSSASYAITLVAATPLLSLKPGIYTGAQTLTITDTTPGATIYYTANGATPTTASTRYTAAIAVKTTQTIKAVAIAPSYSLSAVAAATYTIH